MMREPSMPPTETSPVSPARNLERLQQRLKWKLSESGSMLFMLSLSSMFSQIKIEVL